MKVIEKLYELLKDGLEHSSSELVDCVSHRFGDAIHKLRREGVGIETRKDASGVFWYRLKDAPAEGGQAHQPSLFDSKEALAKSPKRKVITRLRKCLDLIEEVEGSCVVQENTIQGNWLRSHLADAREEIKAAMKVLRA